MRPIAIAPGDRGTKGSILLIFVVSLTAILASIGLAIDIGYLQLVKTRMQTAADAAAIGGVQEINLNGTNNAVTAAKADAASNGFTDGVNSISVTVNRPPLSGYYTGDGAAVEVIIQQKVNALFMSVLGVQATTVSARSVAHRGPGSSCLYVLDPGASNAFQASNGVKVSIGCGVVVDSKSATALTASGGATVKAASFAVAGGYSIKNGASVSPQPLSGQAVQTDPLSYLTPPAVGACGPTSFTLGSGTWTMNPGVYCNGITIANGATVTMTAGTYIIKGGGLTLGGGATITGTGVTIYLTSGSGYGYGPVNIANGVTVKLSAPTTGSYAGILFYQDPSIASPSASSFGGGASVSFSGALYFPTSALSYSNGTSGSYTILVSKTISFAGGTTLNADYSSLPAGPPVKGGAVLAE